MSVGGSLLVAAVATTVALTAGWRWASLWRTAMVLAAGAALAAAATGLVAGGVWEWRPALALGGQPVQLRLDGVSALFLALLAVVGGAGTVYAGEYWPETAHPRSARSGRVWWSLLLASMGVVLLAANGLHFLIAWEVFAVSAYFLITRERQRPEVRGAGWLYLAASHAGTLCLFGFFACLAARTGSWELGPMRTRAELAPLFWLALAGFGLKAGLFPLHIWLPSAHANAPSHVSAILSGVAIKMGIYGLVRFSGWLPVPAAGGWVVVAAGVASAVLGVAFALGQHDLKRLLAYHSVENIGIILIGLGFAIVAAGRGEAAAAWGALALAGGLLHVWNHGLFKALLFLGAGSVLHATGTREMSRLGGLWRTMPWTAGCFTLGAVAISGLPPLNGFVSEWLVFLGLFGAAGGGGAPGWAAVPAAILLGVTGALALACFVKVCGVVFLGLPRSAAAERAHECGWAMRGPMLMLGASCVAIGLAPVIFWPAVARAAAAWRAPAADGEGVIHYMTLAGTAPGGLAALGACHVALAVVAFAAVALLRARVRTNGVARAGTWDCGYAAPTPRMQYTAGSFAEIITGWFAWILRPVRHGVPVAGLFPGYASHAVHTPETVLERVVAPAARLVLGAAAWVRRLQHGRLQFYILYLVAGLIGLAWLALAGGER